MVPRMAEAQALVGLGQARAEDLLDVLALHGRWLQETSNDARRAAHFGLLPTYLIDFQVLYVYAFIAERFPAAASGANYLLRHTEVDLRIGPGTAFELLEEINDVFESKAATRALRGLRDAASRGSEEIYGPLNDVIGHLLDLLNKTAAKKGRGPFGIYLLSSLISEGRIGMLDMSVANLDFDLVKSLSASLDAMRPRFPRSNFADALNYAAVIDSRTRREQGEQLAPSLYLLTNSQPLFNERLLPAGTGSAVQHPISRDLSTALYSALAFEHSESPLALAELTLDHSLRAAHLRALLIRHELEHGYVGHVTEHQLAHAAASNRLTDDTRTALTELADLLSDPIILHTQEIFDDLNVVAANISKQRGEFEGIVASSSRLMEFLIDLGNMVKAGTFAVSGASTAALRYEDLDFGKYSKRRIFLQYSKTKDPILTLEKHRGGGGHPNFIVNWPSSQDSELVLRSFNDAYANHGIKEVEATFGFQKSSGAESDIERWRVGLPLEISDLASLANDERGVVCWIRMDAPGSFSLFADIVSHDPGQSSMIVGVGGRDLIAEHVARLHEETSSRYILTEWVVSALREYGILGNTAA